MALQDDINEAIRKSLPQHIGEELQKLLKQAEVDRIMLARATEANDKLSAQLKSAVIELSAHQALGVRQQAVMAAEQKVTLRELKMELLELKCTMFEARCQEMKEIVSLVFRNNTYKYQKTVIGSHNLNNGYQNTSGSENIDSEGSPG